MAIGSAVSHTTHIRFGVPQGSVLGGTLFTIYIASLPSETATDGVTVDGFSDGTQARVKLSLGPNISSSQLSSPISALSSWYLKCERFFLAHRIKLNIGKTVFFLAAPKSKSGSLPTLSLTIGSTSIAPVYQCLNFIFDFSILEPLPESAFSSTCQSQRHSSTRSCCRGLITAILSSPDCPKRRWTAFSELKKPPPA